jgi:hypothetical protein
MDSYDFIDYNHDWNYPIQWLEESDFARTSYHYWLWRASLAKLGKPCKNLYQEELKSNLAKIDKVERAKYEEACTCVPDGVSFALKKAADNRANQMSSGVDTYEYQVNDPYMIIDADTEDLLAAKCQQDYIKNRLNILSATFSRDLTWAGVAAVVVKYDPVTDKNHVLRVNPKNIWFDTKYSSLGLERFRGYSTMISWKKLKEMIAGDKNEEVNLDIKAPDRSVMKEEENNGKKEWKLDDTAKYSNRKIRTLNGLDIYVEDLNRLATSTQLSGGLNMFDEYDHDLRTCYNLNWYRTFASDPKKRTSSLYNGDDVELTVLYDLDQKIEFKIINRRYVISANRKAFRRKIEFTITNPITGQKKKRLDDFCLDCPLKFQFEEQENMDKFPHPWAPVFSLLDTHDELCGWRAKRDHVSKILSILRIETNAADAASLRGILNIMGIVLDDIQGDINSINFQYDYTPIDSEIAFREQRIQQLLHAYDQFDALQAMGDRASAAESGMALGAVAQGLSTHQNAIMQLYADIARQCIANRVAYSPRQEFPVSNFGDNSSISIQQMALDAIVNVKPVLARKIQEKTIAANALQLVANLGQSGLISKEGIAYLMEQALLGTVPRKVAESFVREQGPSQEEIALAQQQAQNEAMALQQNQQAYEQNPVPYEVDNVMQNQSPDEVEEIIQGMSSDDGGGQIDDETMLAMANGGPQGIDMEMQDGAMSTGLAGLTPETGGEYANPNSMI